MAIKRKFIKIETCTIDIETKPVHVKNELIMLSNIGRMVETRGHFTKISNVKGEHVCITTLNIDQILEKTKNPIELTI